MWKMLFTASSKWFVFLGWLQLTLSFSWNCFASSDTKFNGIFIPCDPSFKFLVFSFFTVQRRHPGRLWRHERPGHLRLGNYLFFSPFPGNRCNFCFPTSSAPPSPAARPTPGTTTRRSACCGPPASCSQAPARGAPRGSPDARADWRITLKAQFVRNKCS